MPKKPTTFYACDPNGVRHTRTSFRTYTHTVFRYNGGAAAYDKRYNELLTTMPVAAKTTWDAYKAWSEGQLSESDKKHITRGGRINNQGDWRRKSGLEFFSKHPDKNVYVSQEVNLTLAALEARRAFYYQYTDMGWCGRYDLALKLAKRGDVITEAVRIV